MASESPKNIMSMYSVFLSGCILTRSLERVSVWRSAKRLLKSEAARSGWNRNPDQDRRFVSVGNQTERAAMSGRDRPEPERIGSREFSAEKQKLGRVINPYQQNYERARRAVSVHKASPSEVHSQQRLSSREQ